MNHLVMLKSGGPPMLAGRAVLAVDGSGAPAPARLCAWFDDDGTLHCTTFRDVCLVPYDPDAAAELAASGRSGGFAPHLQLVPHGE